MRYQLIRIWLSIAMAVSLSSYKPTSLASMDFERLAEAIRLAEGNSNYGILKHYKHTSYRQACINTCQHSYLEWVKTSPRAEKGHRMTFLAFLSRRYAPRHVLNDPNDLNKNWLGNVEYFYNGGGQYE